MATFRLATTGYKSSDNTTLWDGSPYILHPLRPMMQMHTDEERIVAILHDVVEDTEVTLNDLQEAGFGENVLEAVRLLTHEDDLSYEDYVLRLKSNPLARKVKLADLNDNADLCKMSGNEEKDLARLKKYHHGWMLLKD
jgi:(p)ppGpp synthase/HD superfamily hydrolase